MFVFKAQPSWIWSIQTRDTNREPIEDPRVALEQWFYADVHSVFFAKTALEGAKVEQNENIPLPCSLPSLLWLRASNSSEYGNKY